MFHLLFFYLYVYIFLDICLKLFYVCLFYSSLRSLLCAFGLGRYRKSDFLINLWDSLEISFLNFINVLAMVLTIYLAGN